MIRIYEEYLQIQNIDFTDLVPENIRQSLRNQILY
jgi:hypothetical protein